MSAGRDIDVSRITEADLACSTLGGNVTLGTVRCMTLCEPGSVVAAWPVVRGRAAPACHVLQTPDSPSLVGRQTLLGGSDLDAQALGCVEHASQVKTGTSSIDTRGPSQDGNLVVRDCEVGC